MPYLNKYDLCIFDCDGVIFDSNHLKIHAMDEVLSSYFSSENKVKDCVHYFKNNFGKSRFHHIDFFLNNFFDINPSKEVSLKTNILNDFSSKCFKLYQEAKLTPNILNLLDKNNSKKFIASGSEQSELRAVFEYRELSRYFESILGSPTTKDVIIKNILDEELTSNAVMIGDAHSDLLAAENNSIDFIFYSPFSNVKEKMINECLSKKYLVINNFSELIINNEHS